MGLAERCWGAGRLLGVSVAAVLSLAACDEQRLPPKPLLVDGLPVSGSLADAQRAGFTACLPDTRSMRCRRNRVSYQGLGPFDAAVDLVGSDGAGGFDHLTLWHPSDQSALVAVTDKLRDAGWRECLRPAGSRWEGQAIYQRPGASVFAALDLSYWSNRRLTLYPVISGAPRCLS